MIQNILYLFRRTETSITKVAIWEILHGVFLAAPTGLLLLILWELFTPYPDLVLLQWIIGGMCALLLGQLIIARKAILGSTLSIYSMCAKLRIQLGDRLQQLSLGYYKKRNPGDLAAVVLQDVNNFENILEHTIQAIFGAIFGTLFLSIFLLFVDVQLTLLLLAAIPVAFLFVFIAGKISVGSNSAYIAARNNAASRFMEYILGINHLKSFNQTGQKFDSLQQALEELRTNSIKMELIPGPFVLTSFIVLELFFLWMIYNSTTAYTQENMTLPAFIAFLILGYRLYEPLKLVMVNYTILKYMNVSAIRIIQILEAPLQDFKTDTAPTTFDIAFKNVSFTYTDRKILNNISFELKNNSLTALVGASGSGKTTIANLIARFWDVQSGSITIGGQAITDLNPQTVYSLISEVFQQVYLFDDSVINNIKIGNPTASQAQIDAAIQQAQIHEFLDQLPEGLDTKVGEGGAHLSGGQKQRISIARAILKDAPIVLLDEATASLDPENELHIQRAIQALIKDKTVVVIAHKLQTIKNADQILVLENGQVEEQGKHDELLALNGRYASFWHTQQQGKGWRLAGKQQA